MKTVKVAWVVFYGVLSFGAWADDHGASTRAVTAGPVSCSVLRDGKIQEERVTFQLPKETDLDTVVVRQSRARGGNTVLIRSVDPEATLSEDGAKVIRLTKVSTAGDEAVELSVRVQGQDILSYEVGKVCGKGFGFPKPTAQVSPVLEDDEEALRELLSTGSPSALAKVTDPNGDDLEELKPPKSGGGGSSPKPPPSSGPKPSGSSPKPPPKMDPPKTTHRDPPKTTHKDPPKMDTPKTTRKDPPKMDTPKTTHKDPPKTDTPKTTRKDPPKTDTPKTTHKDPPKSGGSTHTDPPKTTSNETGGQRRVNPNLKPDPGHARKTNPKDGSFVEDRGSHQVKFDKEGKVLEVTSTGKTSVYKNGKEVEVRKGATTTKIHDDGSRDVYKNNVKQHTERTVVKNDKTIVQKTVYVDNSRTITKNYNIVNRRGTVYHEYMPLVVYDPWVYRPFYYNPWVSSPYYYDWGWARDPWYGSYGYYFRPYPSYTHPAYWLTDYLIADMLASQHRREEEATRARAEAAETRARDAAHDAREAAEEARAEANRIRNQRPEAITQEVKDQIKAQVEAAIKAHEKGETMSVQNVILDPKSIFVVSGEDIEGPDAVSGKNCSLTSGDIFRPARPTDRGYVELAPELKDKMVQMTVVTSKKGSCPVGSVITVSLTDLQEYLNEFNSGVDRGLGKMKKDEVIKQ